MILPFQQKIMLARLLDCAGLSDPIIVAFRKLKKRRMASWPRTDNGRDCFLEDSGNNVAPAFSRPRARADSAGFIQLHKSRLLSNNHAALPAAHKSAGGAGAGCGSL
jgi:hypothetical protein